MILNSSSIDGTGHDRMKTAFYTIVSNNYLHFARTLLQSIRVQHPEASLYCVIVDTDLEPARQHGDEFTIIELKELNLPSPKEFTFQYSVLELNTAVKPWAMHFLLQAGYDIAVYIDPDITLFKPLVEVMDALKADADIVLTPHLISPITDQKSPTELDIRRSGTYNCGFCATKRTKNAESFLKWWMQKLEYDCVVDMDRGIFTDQSWIDLTPGLFENVFILRHPGYNVAYWNLAQRKIAKSPSGIWLSNGEPLVFFHFSGINPLNPTAFSKHQNRFTLDTLGEAKSLAEQYVEKLLLNGARDFSTFKYGFGVFSNGESIPDSFRREYLRNNQLRSMMSPDPFGKPDALIWSRLGLDHHKTPITWTMHGLWKSRPDLMREFPLDTEASIQKFWGWLLREGSSILGQSLMEAHNRYHEKIESGEVQKIERKSTETQKSTTRANHIYQILFDRAANPIELNELKNSFLTRVQGILSIFSIASRNKTASFSHLARAICYLISEAWAEPDSTIKCKDRSGEFELQAHSPIPYQGLFDTAAGDDSGESGIWCSTEILIPIPNKPGGTFRIEGLFIPELLQRATGRDTLFITASLAGNKIETTAERSDGVVDASFLLPDSIPYQGLLKLEASSFFVPKSIGLNDDTRKLSWRVRKISVDNHIIVDCTQQQKFANPSDLFTIPGINLIGYLGAELGVGEAARSLAKASSSVGIPYSIIDVGYQTQNRQTDRSAWDLATPGHYPIDLIYVNADQTTATLAHLAGMNLESAKSRIAYWHWEQPKLPEKYLSSFSGLDEIWTPTAFVQEAVSSISPIPVFKVPHCVSFSVNPQFTRASFGIPEDRFAVLVMYDFHSYKYRKNPEAAIQAFRTACKIQPSTKATLVIKTINSTDYAEEYGQLKQSVEDIEDVLFLDDVYSREALYGLEANCDCLISLHRAEGFGLGPAEMMFLGKPVIATGWSGNMEFMNTQNSFPVHYKLKALEKTIGVYEAGQVWAEPDIEHAAYCLSKVFIDSNLRNRLGQQARETILSQYNPKVIGAMYRRRLALMGARLGI
jgi:glycosyltransferase involved in cell wall biosynthesis